MRSAQALEGHPPGQKIFSISLYEGSVKNVEICLFGNLCCPDGRAESGETKVKEIRERTGMSSGLFSVYRDRLKRKGVLDTGRYGAVLFTLPRFAEFVMMQMI